MPGFEAVPDATPIGDVSHLIPKHIETQTQLNEYEASNIAQATRKYLLKRRKYLMTVEFIKKVHKEMFEQTWTWAGAFRTVSLNFGVEPIQIPIDIHNLARDIEFWEKDNTLSVFDRSVYIHHRLVKIHPFFNGNGRHARLISDIFLFGRGEKLPNWPDKELIEKTKIREIYIKSMQEADRGNYGPLEAFCRELIT